MIYAYEFYVEYQELRGLEGTTFSAFVMVCDCTGRIDAA